MSTMWIDGDDLNEGDQGFLVGISNPVKGSERYELRDRPPRTNVSHRDTPRGWCGTYNDTCTYGLGVWRVTRVAKNGRAKIVEVTEREELEKFLDEYGFPELIEQCLPITP